jgi:hypothetical protein
MEGLLDEESIQIEIPSNILLVAITSPLSMPKLIRKVKRNSIFLSLYDRSGRIKEKTG